MIFDIFNAADLKDLVADCCSRIVESGRNDALAHAMADALYNVISKPEVEVKFYVKHTDEMIAAIDQFVRVGNRWIDKERTRANTAKNLSVIEFKNGSCITLIKEGNEL